MRAVAVETGPGDIGQSAADRVGAWAGLIFALALLPFLAVVLQGPSLAGSAAEIRAHYVDNAGLLRAVEFGFVVALLFLLLPFVAALVRRLELASTSTQVWARIALAGVVVSVMVFVVEAAASTAVALGGRPADLGPAEFAHFVDQARVFILSGFHLAMGLWVAAASIALLQTNVAPRWVGWLGVALLVPQIVAASWVVGGEVTALHDGLGGVGFVGSLLVWVPAVSLAMLRSSRR